MGLLLPSPAEKSTLEHEVCAGMNEEMTDPSVPRHCDMGPEDAIDAIRILWPTEVLGCDFAAKCRQFQRRDELVRSGPL